MDPQVQRILDAIETMKAAVADAKARSAAATDHLNQVQAERDILRSSLDALAPAIEAITATAAALNA